MSNNQQNTIIRFAGVFALVTIGFAIVWLQIIRIQTIEREKWMKIAETQKKSDMIVPATRGNILDAEGRLLVGSMPQYRIYMDTRVEALHQKQGQLFYQYVDSMADGLSRIIGDKTAGEYKRMMTRAYSHGRTVKERDILLTSQRITYIQKKQIEQLPLIKRGYYKSGIHFETQHRRVKPFNNLASRTLGSIYGDGGHGNAGLEKQFDKELCGRDGVSTRQKINGRWENITEIEAIDGMDIVTTLDANLQDVVENALRKRLEATAADWGCCILMETKTGKIRAISNLDRCEDGHYAELSNHAVTRVEPGSTFKTIALMAALDDGKVKLDDSIRVYKDGWKYFNARHTDSHPKDTVYSVRSALAVSSNIALAKIITRGYEGSAKKFVRRIEKMGLMDSVYCEIPGANKCRIEVPRDTVTLSRMAYGYSVELTPMQLAMFYNAIANDGKMIRPYLVSEIRQNGETVRKFDTEVVRSSICKASTLHDIRECLHDVVWDNDLGTASVRKWMGKVVAPKAQSDLVAIAGKTGTAQLLMDRKYNNKRHRMTFAGYFPEDKPQYTCVCMINYPHNYPAYDAGFDCGGVVRQIAEKTIAYKDSYVVKDGKLVLAGCE